MNTIKDRPAMLTWVEKRRGNGVRYEAQTPFGPVIVKQRRVSGGASAWAAFFPDGRRCNQAGPTEAKAYAEQYMKTRDQS